MNNDLINTDIEEIVKNICLFSNRLSLLLKYTKFSEMIDLFNKNIIVDFYIEIAENIKTELENIRNMLNE